MFSVVVGAKYSESVSLATPRDQTVVKVGESMMDVLIFTVRCVLVSCFDPSMQCGACLNEPAVLNSFVSSQDTENRFCTFFRRRDV